MTKNAFTRQRFGVNYYELIDKFKGIVDSLYDKYKKEKRQIELD